MKKLMPIEPTPEMMRAADDQKLHDQRRGAGFSLSSNIYRAMVEAAPTAKRGPKPLHGENMQAFHFRMTKAQREKLDRLGGAAWIRAQITKAKEAQ